ncbi:MAG: isocitrate lyase/PEP mutase family protein [Gammaproteobacteria bacterium]|jgi:2-methylisocitrate lyase-like PEP mutase family enzyme
MRQDDYGYQLRAAVQRSEIIPFIGVYDVFSATLAAEHFDGIFISGFSFAASFYGLPDIGLIAWSDIVAFCQRVRAVLPRQHIIVDIDDGYGDMDTAAHVVSLLQGAGASGIIMEDQQRPRRCGHLDGKRLLDLDQYVMRLEKVLASRKDLFVVARTDAHEQEDVARRVHAYVESGADAILIDGLHDLDYMKQVTAGLDVPVMFNQILGGKSAPFSLDQLRGAGVSLANYSTPCLFAAQEAINTAMTALRQNDGKPQGGIGIQECNAILNDNLNRRDRS